MGIYQNFFQLIPAEKVNDFYFTFQEYIQNKLFPGKFGHLLWVANWNLYFEINSRECERSNGKHHRISVHFV